MLAVIFRFAGGRYAKALLALVDDPARIARVVAQIDAGGADDPEMETQTLFTINVPERPTSGETVLRDPAGRSLTLLLHRRDGHLAGLVQLINGEPVTLSPGDVRALRGLADQLAIILENRLLLEETDKVLSETRALYEMNKALVATRSSLDVLGAIRQTVGQRAHALALAELAYSDQQQLNAFDVYALVTPAHAAEVSAALYDDTRANAFLQLMAHWDVLGDQVDVVPDVAAAEQRHPALDYFEANGIRARALVVIPVFDGGALRQQLIMTYDAPQHFTERDRRLFTALKDQVRVVLENQRLLRASSVGSVELESQVKLLQAVVEFVAQIAVARTENEMLSSGAEAIVRAAGVDHVGISIINPDGNSATVTGEYPDLGAVGSQIPADNPLTQHILREQAPRFINNIDDEPLLADEPRQAMIAMGIKSLVLYPLIDGRGQALGIIGMDSYRSGREFTPQMYDVVRTIAAQMVISLQNIRQLRETQRQAQQLQKLSELNQTIQPMMSMPAILTGALDGIGEIFPVDRVAVYAVGADRGQPLLVLERIGAEILTHTPPEPLALDAPTAAGRAWTGRVLVNVPDASAQGILHSRGGSSGSVLAAPLFTRGVVVGLIEIGHAQTHGFSDSDALIFRQLVNQISAAIENAEAYTAIQRSARAKTLVNDISSQLQKQSEIADVLNVTMTELGRALGARKARIRLGDVNGAGAGTPGASDAPTPHNPQETEGN
jgi:GAF domain-containing protein